MTKKIVNKIKTLETQIPGIIIKPVHKTPLQVIYEILSINIEIENQIKLFNEVSYNISKLNKKLKELKSEKNELINNFKRIFGTGENQYKDKIIKIDEISYKKANKKGEEVLLSIDPDQTKYFYTVSYVKMTIKNI